jgi:hypothetical protein
MMSGSELFASHFRLVLTHGDLANSSTENGEIIAIDQRVVSNIAQHS